MPSISQVVPATGPMTGATRVSLSGSGFVAGATVMFAGAAATNVSVSGDGQTITCTASAGSYGAADVVVANPDGSSDTNSYFFGPTITGVSPLSGPMAGGTAVMIYGQGFQLGVAVTFGVQDAVDMLVASDGTSITCLTPGYAYGAVDVTVSNPGGDSATLANGYSFGPVIGNVSPAARRTDRRARR
ncbi:MAG TPA: IPT/TIG domain-containing protein [Pirellulales bacterium]|jgi:hypothetical protein|nr:IPT/TIG domain-containing protein [Pirellulales bacterium]